MDRCENQYPSWCLSGQVDSNLSINLVKIVMGTFCGGSYWARLPMDTKIWISFMKQIVISLAMGILITSEESSGTSTPMDKNESDESMPEW